MPLLEAAEAGADAAAGLAPALLSCVAHRLRRLADLARRAQETVELADGVIVDRRTN